MKIIYLLLLFTFFGLGLHGQDPQFTQFYNAPIYTNPAYAGSAINLKDGEYATRVNLNYRNQWPNLNGGYQTVNASWDRHFNKLHGGLGGSITHDVEGSGIFSKTSLSGVYAFAANISKKIMFRSAIQFSYVDRQINLTNITFSNPANQPLPPSRIAFPNLGMGAIAYAKNYHIGFAIHNLIEPNQSFFSSSSGVIPKRYTIHAGGKIIVADELQITPFALFMQQHNANQLNIGSNFSVMRLLIGAGFRQSFSTFRNADAIIGIIGYKASRFQITYSYDRTVSSAAPAATDSHEISMNYFVSLKKNLPDLPKISPSY